jgi:hypothetical protein
MSFSAMNIKCAECGRWFRAYKDRKGSDGKYPKFCSRPCYAKTQARDKKRRTWQLDEGVVIRVPAKFFEDHEERDCEPACTPFKRSARFVWLYWNDAGLDELLDDAKHYAFPDMFGSDYAGLVRSAKATVKAIEKARQVLAAARRSRVVDGDSPQKERRG